MTDELRIAHLRIAHQGSNPELGNPEIHITYQSICLGCNSSSFVLEITKLKESHSQAICLTINIFYQKPVRSIRDKIENMAP